MSFEIGRAEIDVTPPVGTPMGGFAGREHGAVGIHDPLRSKALAISDGSHTCVLIGNDIISADYEFVEQVTNAIAERTGLSAEEVIINFSHTHSGPLMRDMAGMGEASRPYRDVLVHDLAGLVEMALQDMQPVTVTSHTALLQVGINRRERTEDGGTTLGRDPGGIVDTTVEVLKFTGPDGKPEAIWFSHAAHGVVLGGNNYYFSADWPGYAQRTLEKVYPDATVMFGQGCCGNINSDPVGGTFEDARRLGTRAAGAVMVAIEDEGTELDGPITFGKTIARLPQHDPPSVEESEAFIAEQKKLRDEALKEGKNANAYSSSIQWGEWLRDLAQQGVTDQTMPFAISALGIGQHAIVGLAGEVFFEYALNIAERSPFERTSVLGTTNGCVAYIPTAAEMPYGGYEVKSSNRFYRQLELKPEAEQVAIDRAVALLNEIRAE
ncbi:MAG: neutral/alkaline non-lysosomal ceramidase N-terminal domain-containing protein [Armatimonadota bacterium]